MAKEYHCCTYEEEAGAAIVIFIVIPVLIIIGCFIGCFCCWWQKCCCFQDSKVQQQPIPPTQGVQVGMQQAIPAAANSNNSGLANFPAANPVHVAGTFCSGCGLPRQGQVNFCNRCGIQFPGGGGGRPPPAPVSPSTSNLPGRPRLFYHGTSIEAGANAPS